MERYIVNICKREIETKGWGTAPKEAGLAGDFSRKR